MNQCAEADQRQYGRCPEEADHHKQVKAINASMATTGSIDLLIGEANGTHNGEPQRRSESKNLKHGQPLIYQ